MGNHCSVKLEDVQDHSHMHELVLKCKDEVSDSFQIPPDVEEPTIALGAYAVGVLMTERGSLNGPDLILSFMTKGIHSTLSTKSCTKDTDCHMGMWDEDNAKCGGAEGDENRNCTAIFKQPDGASPPCSSCVDHQEGGQKCSDVEAFTCYYNALFKK